MDRMNLASCWSKEQTCRLLRELQKHPVIYDQTHPLYRLRAQRRAALRKIVTNLRPYKPQLTPKIICNKIRNLKGQYCKERKYIKDSLVNLKPGQLPYKSKLWCFELLTFFDKQGTYDKNDPSFAVPDDEVEDEEDEQQDYDCMEDDTYEEPINSFEEIEIDEVQRNDFESENSKKRNELHSHCLKLMECLTKEMKTIENDKGGGIQQTPNTFLGLMVESELANVPEEIYDEAKWEIIRILEEASKKNRLLTVEQQ